MTRIFGLIVLLAVCSCAALAQQPSSDDVLAAKEDVEKLFASMHIREQMKNMMEVMGKQSKQTAHDALRKKLPDISQSDLDRIDAMSDRAMKNVDTDALIDDMIPVYQRHLTKADVAAMTAFYETPTGQKILREQPEMTAEAMKAMQPRMEKMMAENMDEAEKMAKDMASGSKSRDDGQK